MSSSRSYCKSILFHYRHSGGKSRSFRISQRPRRSRKRLLFTLTTYQSEYESLRQDYARKIEDLPEVQAWSRLVEHFEKAQSLQPRPTDSQSLRSSESTVLFPDDQLPLLVDSMLATFALHMESRIASLIGKGFYTIGPCGEETLAAAALVLEPQDSIALHYRHSGIQIMRQLCSLKIDGDYDQNLQQIILDRARGYTVSRQDPVTGGVHCSIGSTFSNDYVVTSTLASQCSPAVGRALASSFVQGDGARAVSFVTLGDGSLHHGHFWSAFHLARHARHRKIKCPVVFGVSDNGLSISYDTKGYCKTLFGNDDLVSLFEVDGNDFDAVYSKTKEAVDFSRHYAAPAVVLYQNIQRRFGHAATDRQLAYLEQADIQARAESETLQHALTKTLERGAHSSFVDLLDRMIQIQRWTQQAFEKASSEPKVSREEMMERVRFSSAIDSQSSVHTKSIQEKSRGTNTINESESRRSVMRKNMTRAFEEILETDERIVYVGEDVRHGGYYLVTDSLAHKFPNRIIDFPPDEASLLGAAQGLSQNGVTPIVEIPYAKYLDCASDMMAEIAITPWLTQRNYGGMLVRLQGFDRGLFGGNFHTHNSLYNVLLPGVEVMCYSNGFDYARGLRFAVQQIKKGQLVVFVDCTNLLNRRHLNGNDRAWETIYPEDPNDVLDFDSVFVYKDTRTMTTKSEYPRVAIVSYGNGVVTSLQARNEMNIFAQVDIIDSPCLNRVPKGLMKALEHYDHVLFADICKQGPGSVFASMVTEEELQNFLSTKIYRIVAAPRTYNPLGSVETFLNVSDIVDATERLISSSN